MSFLYQKLMLHLWIVKLWALDLRCMWELDSEGSNLLMDNALTIKVYFRLSCVIEYTIDGSNRRTYTVEHPSLKYIKTVNKFTR